MNFIRNYAATNGIQLPDRVSLEGTQTVQNTAITSISQPAQVTSTVETVKAVEVSSSIPATVATSTVPLQYTFNPAFIQQTPSVVLQPQVITSTQSIPSPITSSGFIPTGARTVPTVQMVQSVSPPPAQLLQTVGGTGNFVSRTVLSSVPAVSQSVLTSKGPTINILPSSTIKSSVQQTPVQTSVFDGRQVLKLPEVRQIPQTSIIQSQNIQVLNSQRTNVNTVRGTEVIRSSDNLQQRGVHVLQGYKVASPRASNTINTFNIKSN